MNMNFSMFVCFVSLILALAVADQDGSPLFSLKKKLKGYYDEPPQTGSEVIGINL